MFKWFFWSFPKCTFMPASWRPQEHGLVQWASDSQSCSFIHSFIQEGMVPFFQKFKELRDPFYAIENSVWKKICDCLINAWPKWKALILLKSLGSWRKRKRKRKERKEKGQGCWREKKPWKSGEPQSSPIWFFVLDMTFLHRKYWGSTQFSTIL